jgi:hypothetical protein
VALVRPEVLALLSIPLGAVLALVVVRIRGESLAGLLERRARMLVSRGVLHTDRSALLPGVLGGLRVIEATAASGRDVGLAWLPGTGVTALVPVEPLGVELVSQDEAAGWIQGWSDWLAHLGYLPDVSSVAVCVVTGAGPPGDRAFEGGLAQSIIGEVAAHGGHTRARTVVSLTVAAPQKSEPSPACATVLDLVAGIGALARCGVTVLPAMSAQEVAMWVRQGFDPSLPDMAAAPADMGPTAVQESWATYRHDSVVSACFAWHEPPGMSLSRRLWRDCWVHRVPQACLPRLPADLSGLGCPGGGPAG